MRKLRRQVLSVTNKNIALGLSLECMFVSWKHFTMSIQLVLLRQVWNKPLSQTQKIDQGSTERSSRIMKTILNIDLYLE